MHGRTVYTHTHSHHAHVHSRRLVINDSIQADHRFMCVCVCLKRSLSISSFCLLIQIIIMIFKTHRSDSRCGLAKEAKESHTNDGVDAMDQDYVSRELLLSKYLDYIAYCHQTKPYQSLSRGAVYLAGFDAM